MKTIKQGDSYPLRMAIALNGQLIDDSTIYSVDTVEICLRDIRKEYHSDGSGEVSYENGVFSLSYFNYNTLGVTFVLQK